MKRTLWIIPCLLMAMTTVGCNGSESVTDNPPSNEDNELKSIEITADELQLVKSGNDFAFNLFRQAATGQTAPLKGKSVILSPISITYALGMLNNGAAGETQQQINQVLGFDDAASVNAFCRKMLTEAPSLDKLTKVLISNNIYVNKDYTLNPGFVTKARDYYDATPESRDFHDGQTMDVINKWAANHTEQMIPKVLDEQTFDAEAVSYLLNAIYFKGSWSEKFDKSQTKDEPFEGAAGKVPMMHQNKEFAYTEDDLCQALRMPYGNGAYTMTVLLPREGKTVAEVAAALTAEKWQSIFRYMDEAIVDVKLPRFESNTDVELNSIMSALGMPLAFTDFAQFPEFCDTATKIGFMKQVARIKLNEEGTEAAAVTVIGMNMVTSVGQEPRHVNFHATRPFLYVISEQSTGAIFFMGTYTGN